MVFHYLRLRNVRITLCSAADLQTCSVYDKISVVRSRISQYTNFTVSQLRRISDEWFVTVHGNNFASIRMMIVMQYIQFGYSMPPIRVRSSSLNNVLRRTELASRKRKDFSRTTRKPV